MKLYQDTSGIDKVVNTASKIVNATERVVSLIRNIGDIGSKVGEIKTSTKIGLLLGGVLALSLFPLRLSYDSKTGEGEYKSLAVGVKRTQRPARTTDGRTHDLSWEAFPTVKVKPQDVKPCELPPARTKQAVKAVPLQAQKIRKARVRVPVKLKVQEDVR